MKPKRRSIRLPGYDYASAGWYFVTICCHKRQHLFGEIVRANCIRPDGPVMELNQLGRIVHEEWLKTAEIRPEVELGEFVVMPNHFHAIVINVGADPCVGPDKTEKWSEKGKHIGLPLHVVIQWFKTMTTNEFIRNVKFHGWEPFENKIWQRNYYEHIIRNEDSYRQISNYILHNPQNWLEDEHYSL